MKEILLEVFAVFLAVLPLFVLMIPLTWGFCEFADKCKMFIKRRKTGYTTFCVWLSKDEILMLKYALIRTGDLDLSQLNDKLSDVLLENGYSPHLTAYRYLPDIEVITYDEFNERQQKKGETDDKS